MARKWMRLRDMGKTGMHQVRRRLGVLDNGEPNVARHSGLFVLFLPFLSFLLALLAFPTAPIH